MFVFDLLPPYLNKSSYQTSCIHLYNESDSLAKLTIAINQKKNFLWFLWNTPWNDIFLSKPPSKKNFVNIFIPYKEQFSLNFIYSGSQMIKSPRFNQCIILWYKTFLKNSDLFQENEEIPISGISNPRMILKTMSQCLCKMKCFWN